MICIEGKQIKRAYKTAGGLRTNNNEPKKCGRQKGRSTLTMCDATLPHKPNTFCVHFDLLNNDSVINSTLSSKDQSVSVATADE